MFSTDPEVYGAGLDLRASAVRMQDRLRPLVASLAMQIEPPFNPARRRKIIPALDAAQAEVTRLGQLVARYFVETRDPFDARVDFLRLSDKLLLWQDCRARLEQTLAARPVPLLPNPPPAGSPAQIEAAGLERVFERLHLALSPIPPHLIREGHYGDIPLPMAQFMALIHTSARLLRAMDRAEPWSFLDVGCGLGLKLLAAQEIFDRVEGVEITPTTAARAKTLLATARRNHKAATASPTPWLTATPPQAKARVHRADALTFSDYGGFDVIYAYRPIADPTLWTSLQHRIADLARPGTIILLPHPDCSDTGLQQLAPHIYLKPKPGLDPAALIRRAGHIGPQRAASPNEPHGDEGFVAPLAQALRHWGHMP